MRSLRWVVAGFALGALVAFVASLLRPQRHDPQTGYVAPSSSRQRHVVTRGAPI